MRSILIVEDDAEIGRILKTALMEECYRVFVVCDGRSAIDILSIATPDLFLVDYWLPDTTGVELVSKFRSIIVYESTPVIIMSACFPHMACPSGMRCLAKPFDLDELLLIIGESLVKL